MSITTTKTVECPRCQGLGGISGQYCRVCCGYARVTVEYAARLKEGERKRLERIRRGVSLTAEAERLGITPRELDDREQGR